MGRASRGPRSPGRCRPSIRRRRRPPRRNAPPLAASISAISGVRLPASLYTGTTMVTVGCVMVMSECRPRYRASRRR